MAFQEGQSGNPAGRPKGSKDKRTELRELLEPHAPALIEKAVSMALEGDTTAMKMCLDRILPAMKSVEVKNDTNPGEITIVHTIIDDIPSCDCHLQKSGTTVRLPKKKANQ